MNVVTGALHRFGNISIASQRLSICRRLAGNSANSANSANNSKHAYRANGVSLQVESRSLRNMHIYFLDGHYTHVHSLSMKLVPRGY